MASRALTAVAIESYKAGPARREIPDGKAQGLYLIVQPSGGKRFCVRYRHGGKTRKLTLPRGLSLAAARVAAANAMNELEQGRDPAALELTAKQKAAEAAKDTVAAICAEYLRRPEHKRLRTIAVRERILQRLVYPTLGARQIDSVRRSELVRLLDKIEDTSGSVMADQTLGVLRRIFNWHMSRSDEFRSPIIRGMARTRPAERARSRVLSDSELQAVWLAAEASDHPFGKLVQFLCLSCARRSEASSMKWVELENGDWVLPPSRNKTGSPLVRPLSAPARELLDKLPRINDCPFVFTTNGRTAISGFSRLKARFDAACGVRDWRIHDLRRSSRSLLSRVGISADVAGLCLGHALPGLIRQTYDRHSYRSEKTHAFESLAAAIARIAYPPPGNVTALRS
jgi:integrase